MPRWSLAARLTAWFAITAFLLVAGATFVQYRTLVTSLAEEDDQMMLERLASAPTVLTESAPGSGPTQQRLLMRELDAQCRPVAPLVGPEFPTTNCAEPTRFTPVFRNWRSPGGTTWRIVSEHMQPPRTGWREVFLDRSNDTTLLRAYRFGLLSVLAVALLLSMMLGYLLARRGLRPLAELASRMALVDARSLHQRLSTPEAPPEIQTLVVSFDDMLARLEAAFRSLVEFSGHLAHEFRTPLHILAQQAEVTLTRARTQEEYREVLESSLEEFDRLRRMVDDILLLARTDDPQATLQRTRINVAAELADIAAYFEPEAHQKGVALVVEVRESLTLDADPMLVRRALVNLVANALRHTSSEGSIRLSGAVHESTVELDVRDTGEGIAPEFLPHVFDRHYRVHGSRALESDGGSGLGLAIVRSIMQLHGGSDAISSATGGGTSVTLLFPATPPGSR